MANACLIAAERGLNLAKARPRAQADLRRGLPSDACGVLCMAPARGDDDGPDPGRDAARLRGSAGLAEADALADPIAQFERWFDDARRAEVHEPNAMTLATVDAAGQPAARMVLLKGVDRARPRLLHQPRQPQGQRAVGQSQGGAGVLVGAAAAPGALRGHDRGGRCGRGGRLLREPAARAASSPPGRRRRARVIEGRAALEAEERAHRERFGDGRGAAAAVLGRLPPGAGRGGVLARPREPPARPAALYQRATTAGGSSGWRRKQACSAPAGRRPISMEGPRHARDRRKERSHVPAPDRVHHRCQPRHRPCHGEVFRRSGLARDHLLARQGAAAMRPRRPPPAHHRRPRPGREPRDRDRPARPRSWATAS